MHTTWSTNRTTRTIADFSQCIARPTSKAASLLECAARCGCYDFGKALLDNIAQLLGIGKEPGRTLFDLCFALAKEAPSESRKIQFQIIVSCLPKCLYKRLYVVNVPGDFLER